MDVAFCLELHVPPIAEPCFLISLGLAKKSELFWKEMAIFCRFILA